jgi:hypothetical protein
MCTERQELVIAQPTTALSSGNAIYILRLGGACDDELFQKQLHAL